MTCATETDQAIKLSTSIFLKLWKCSRQLYASAGRSFMIGTSSLSRQTEELLIQELSKKDSEVKVQVKRNSFGWLRLYVITTIFEAWDSTERKQLINKIIAALHINLDDFPFANYQLLTPREATEKPQTLPVHMPLWSEILLAPDPENPAIGGKDYGKGPFIVTFYAFKGGVGQSTSLALVANSLVTRGHRVVMIDFDLEAPGLSCVHPV